MPGEHHGKVSVLLSLSRESKTALCVQIEESLAARILSGELAAGERLPGTRTLARSLDVSVDTVLAAYRELAAQGFIQARPRSGYVVSGALRKQSAETSNDFPDSGALPIELTEQAEQAAKAALLYREGAHEARPFAGYASFMAQSLQQEWLRLSAQLARSPWLHANYTEPAGYRPLREAIALRMRQQRGLKADPDNIIVTAGTVQSLNLALSLLFARGSRILLPAPALPLYPHLVAWQGHRAVFAPSDENGLKVEGLLGDGDPAQGVLVSPASHQPLSVAMSAKRRKTLLDWAARTGGWILEDDADNGVWLTAEPMAPLAARQSNPGRVIYMGSFSQSFGPWLRTSYMVVPKTLARAFAGARLLADRCGSEQSQALLALFLRSSAYDAHMRKMQRQFRDRAELMQQLFAERLSDLGALLPARCGPRLTFVFRKDSQIRDAEAARKLSERGVVVTPLSWYRSPDPVNGLVLGFGTFSRQEISKAFDTLEQTLHALAQAA